MLNILMEFIVKCLVIIVREIKFWKLNILFIIAKNNYHN